MVSSDIINDSVFWLSLITIVLATMRYSIKYCSRCKISNVSCCWGLISTTRDVKSELEIERVRIENNVQADDSSGEFKETIRPRPTLPPSPLSRS
jgi:hypothetical protein